jgi:hypothetical protein
MKAKKHEFEKDSVEKVLFKHLVDEGICDHDALRGRTWWEIENGLSITVRWWEEAKCEEAKCEEAKCEEAKCEKCGKVLSKK